MASCAVYKFTTSASGPRQKCLEVSSVLLTPKKFTGGMTLTTSVRQMNLQSDTKHLTRWWLLQLQLGLPGKLITGLLFSEDWRYKRRTHLRADQVVSSAGLGPLTSLSARKKIRKCVRRLTIWQQEMCVTERTACAWTFILLPNTANEERLLS